MRERNTWRKITRNKITPCCGKRVCFMPHTSHVLLCTAHCSSTFLQK